MKRPRSPHHPHTMVESHQSLVQGYDTQRTQPQSPGDSSHRSIHGSNNDVMLSQSPGAVTPKQIPLDQGEEMDLSIIHTSNDDDSDSDGCFQDADEFELMLDASDTHKQQEGDRGSTNDEQSRRRFRPSRNYDNCAMMEDSEANLQAECFKNKEMTDYVGTTTKDVSVRAFLQPKPLEITNSDSWKTVVEHVEKGLTAVLENLNNGDGIQSYLDWCETRRRSHNADREAAAREAELAQLEAKIDGDPRTYQRQLLERAKQGNVIVHLGTGYGKTLIALLLIKHVRNQIGVTAKTIFLVPSVALALQHTTTLRANLPYTVATACYETSNNTDAYPVQLADADILVATQGALWDLLLHYQDLVSLDRYALLVVDECHYCAGSHAYRLIFQKFYHSLPTIDRPHVLGLTASPIINLRESHSEEELEMMIQTLQETMDAVLVSVSQEDDFVAHSQSISEEVVHYQGAGVSRALPSADNLLLHPSRYRELRQLEVLYPQVGPLVVSLYCKVLLHELSRNEFEEESPAQFETVLCHLRSVTQWCEQESHAMGNEGRTDKLLALESILERELTANPAEAVGLVFCHRRITAVALHNYFRWREGNKDHLGKLYGWGKSGERRRQSQQNGIMQGMGRTMDDGDPFADAEDDPLLANGDYNLQIVAEKDGRIDAEFDMKKTMRMDDSGYLTSIVAPWMETHIQSTVLVRDVTSIFTSLSTDQSQASDERKKNWLHIDHRVQDVLSKLRRQELNLLFATSVVEEGVDVQACSVVVAFDSIRSTKSYVQMKGRARRRKAKFFVFQDSTGPSGKATVSLESARNMEARLRTFIACKAQVGLGSGDGSSDVHDSNDYRLQLTLEPELSAARQGFYQGNHGTVDLQSAKGLLTRYCLSVPLDPHVRLSREAFMAHMPDFRENGLVLPSHLPSSIRVVVLPAEFRDQSKRDKKKVLSLMACVRLHYHRLLNERLLPLSQTDIQHHILRAANPEFPDFQTVHLPLDLFFEPCRASRPVFVRTISYDGEIFLHTQQQIRGRGHQLAVITVSESTSDLPAFLIDHKEFGLVETQYSIPFAAKCDENHFEILLDFFILLLDERWRRSTKHSNFKIRDKEEYNSVFMPYIVGLVGSDGKLDWDFMTEILMESHRTDGEREAAVRCLPITEALGTPRLWTSTIDGHTTYIAYGPADETVSAPFPVEKEGVYTYKDYFEKDRGALIASDVQLFDVQRYWSLPSSFSSLSVSEPRHEPLIKAEDSKYTMSEQLSAVKIPQTVVQEGRIANAHVGLLSCFLPQVLFVYERFERTRAFVESCSFNLPKLGSYLARLPLEAVATAMTCKSCGMDVSYEKLEWFGDAVLKMIQTESLLKSIELKDWIQVLHEGDLSMLRQEMGSNNRLEGICQHFELGRFVMSENLARGLWLPSLLDLCTGLRVEQTNSAKIYADVMESILGLVYVEFGYDAALAVGDELQLTVPWQERSVADALESVSGNVQFWDSLVRRTTGYISIRNSDLFAEAFSHASGGYPSVSSYERLEWTGDAVLCLAIRQWIWHYFPDADLRKSVILEGAIISNEVLAFVAVQLGLHHYLQHKDHTLPSRIESYICSVQQDGRGLWSTDPPKVIADIVESLIGAIYVDGGLEAGMEAARTLLKPVLDVILIHGEYIDLVHPKKKLQELVGELLVVETTWEDNFSQNIPLLDGSQLRFADPYGTQGIGYVRFMDTLLVAVSDSSRAVARNKACAIIVQVLESDLNLLQRLQNLRYLVESTATAGSSDKQVEMDD